MCWWSVVPAVATKDKSKLECTVNQCNTDDDCAGDNLVCQRLPGIADTLPGVCLFKKPVPTSSANWVCTHKEGFEAFPKAVEFCANSTMDTAAQCSADKNGMVCNWNTAPVEPNTDIETCTHKEEFSQSAATVKSCAAITTETDCEAPDTGCVWNYPPVEPSNDMDACTHSFESNFDRPTVNHCAAQTSKDDCYSGSFNCIWNECENNFGGDDYPCSSEDAPYCVKSNGLFNRGKCSDNEDDVIKCVPELDADFTDRDQLLACQVTNTEDTCALNEKCRWEGEKTICHDTPGWSAFRGGVTCKIFSDRYCEDGDVIKRFRKFAGSQFNNPTENCCACGKEITEQASLPAVPVNPLVTYNKCRPYAEDANNYHVVEYCESIGNDFLTCNLDNGEYCQQKCGKGNERIKIVLPESQPQGLEKSIKQGQGTVVIELKQVFNQITEIEPKGTECGVGGF
jgi:hypothetical protein